MRPVGVMVMVRDHPALEGVLVCEVWDIWLCLSILASDKRSSYARYMWLKENPSKIGIFYQSLSSGLDLLYPGVRRSSHTGSIGPGVRGEVGELVGWLGQD